MPNKIDRMKKSKLSSTVLDYYYKYGQNRDLEKYLRLKRCNSSKSSSDCSSTKNIECNNLSGESERAAKSLEKLNLSDRKSKQKTGENRETKSSDNLSDNSKATNSQTKKSDGHRIKIEKKTRETIKGKSKSKSYNLNLESSIEINLPPSCSMPILPFQKENETNKQSTQTFFYETTETQTEVYSPKRLEAKPLEMASEQKSLEKPIVPARISAPPPLVAEEPKSLTDNIQESSPASSVASAKVRLEWDSMADIGYNKIIDFKSQSNSNLTTFEKNALTKFFAKRGLNFDDNLVIVASPDKLSPLQKRKFTQSAIEMREAKQLQSSMKDASPLSNKQLWENALVKYRQKYGKEKRIEAMAAKNAPVSTQMVPNTTDSIRFTSLAEANHSTPVAGTSAESKSKNLEIEVAKLSLIEKACQTAVIDVEAIGVQVEQPSVSQATKSVQISDCKWILKLIDLN